MTLQRRLSPFVSLLSAILLGASVCSAMLTPAAALAAEVPEPQIELIPAKAAGQSWQVHTQIFKPEGKGPFPLIVFSHGRAPKAADRQALISPAKTSRHPMGSDASPAGAFRTCPCVHYGHLSYGDPR